MKLLGIALISVGLVMAIASRISSKPPVLYLGLPGVVLAAIGIAILSSDGINLKDYLPAD